MTRYIIFLPTLLVMLLLQTGCAQTTLMTKHYNEIPTPKLDYIAMIRTNRGGSSEVVYNSEICQDIGKACGFFRSQAYAHVPLNHQPFLAPDQYAPSLEREADCWAARYAPREEVVAAVELLNDAERARDLPITGNPAERAERIRDCARQAGNWSA